MVKKHQNSPSSSVSFFARCTVRSLLVVLGALLFVVTNHYYNAETVFKPVDFKITDKEAPQDVQITNKEAPVDEEASKDFQITNKEAPVDEEAPKDFQITNQDTRVDEDAPKDVQITDQDASVDEEAPKDVQITDQDATVDEEAPKDVLLTNQPKDVLVTSQEVLVDGDAPDDVQITSKAAPSNIQRANDKDPYDVQKTDKEALVDVQTTNEDAPVEIQIEQKKAPEHVDSLAGCDLFKGKWVYDNVSYPLYKDRDCKFMFGDLACESYGRKDLEYQHWRWQPHGCDLPRFDGKKLLEKLRNKRLIYVGDSLNRNLWVSMMCMLDAYIADDASKQMRLLPPLYTFKAQEYNASFDFYWSPLLVESGSDNASNHQFSDIKVRIESIEKHAKEWNDADILVFNSYRWWRVPTVKVFRDASFEGPKQVYKVYKMLRGYKMSLKTLTNWLEGNVNRAKTKLFFVSMAANHQSAPDWGKPRGQNCFTETEPIAKEGYWGSGSDPKMMHIAEDAIGKLKQRGVDMTILNITQLTEYRKDAHPSIFRKLWRPLSKEKLSDPRNYADCTHWCLPGVPDVWNEILYAYIMRG